MIVGSWQVEQRYFDRKFHGGEKKLASATTEAGEQAVSHMGCLFEGPFSGTRHLVPRLDTKQRCCEHLLADCASKIPTLHCTDRCAYLGSAPPKNRAPRTQLRTGQTSGPAIPQPGQPQHQSKPWGVRVSVLGHQIDAGQFNTLASCIGKHPKQFRVR